MFFAFWMLGREATPLPISRFDSAGVRVKSACIGNLLSSFGQKGLVNGGKRSLGSCENRGGNGYCRTLMTIARPAAKKQGSGGKKRFRLQSYRSKRYKQTCRDRHTVASMSGPDYQITFCP